jgi:hypothetical protein
MLNNRQMKMCLHIVNTYGTSVSYLTEEISNKQTQQKINYFFKPMNVSNQHEPGPSCSKD